MKIRRLSPAVALFLLTAVSTTLAEPASGDSLSTKPTLTQRDTSVANAVRPDSDLFASPKAAPKGTLDAPVDGKDGKPHAGPWVETSAERDRKKEKAKEADGKAVPIKSDATESDVEHIGPDGKPIPHSNDGVMDDPHRLGPKEGTRGTEGGVSEKSKESKLAAEKVPETPKEVPPLPHSEQEKIPNIEDKDLPETKALEDGEKVLEKPADLPEKPHDIPPPKSPAPVSDDPLKLTSPPSTSKSSSGSSKESEPEGKVISPIHSLFLSLTMILFSEIGDKTFLVAALMAMRHPRLVVFSAAFSALIAMTVLSAILGHAVPTLIPKSLTKLLAAGLFLVFGVKMFKEGRAMSPDEGVSEEMKEVEMELEEKEHQQRRMSRRRSSISPYALEAGRAGRKSRSTNRLPSPPESVSSSSSREASPVRSSTWENVLVGVNNLCSLLLSPAWVQTFVMTFLGEWGDRSQIATIAMAAGQDYWWVTVGAITGHGLCTAAAVIGGRAIAGRVSLRAVTLGGAVAFFVFGILYLIEAIY
ncbi:hypothetical protein VTN77DRAFT_2219 [Rasamsonia byssochlamydoides]|uniref:uncharacterized protein n=1 Tax=Rasamsonia byssochlamydoides TaxID=89139 RepID=UPI003744A2D1